MNDHTSPLSSPSSVIKVRVLLSPSAAIISTLSVFRLILPVPLGVKSKAPLVFVVDMVLASIVMLSTANAVRVPTEVIAL